MNFLKNHFSQFLMAFSVIFISSCGDKGKTIDDVTIDPTLLNDYTNFFNSPDTTKSADGIDIYIDYSDGMKEGMEAINAINTKITSGLAAKKSVTYFKIGALAEPKKIDINEPSNLWSDVKNFNDKGSNLKVAIDSIIKNANIQSIFITDFEDIINDLYKLGVKNWKSPTIDGKAAPGPHPISTDAWAAQDFSYWLKKGNQIDIFVKKFQKKDNWFNAGKTPIDNWIYTIVFTPKAKVFDEENNKNSILNLLIQSYDESEHFSYNLDHFIIQQKYSAKEQGGANEMIIVQNIINQPKNKYEYYEFNGSDLMDFNTDDAQKDKRIISKMKITYIMPEIETLHYGIKVTDISSSLVDYFSFKNQGDAEVEVDPETGKKDTIAGKHISYVYQEGLIVDDMFDFVYNTDLSEIGIKLKPDFAGVTLSTLYKIDLVVKEIKLNSFENEKNILRLNYKNGYVLYPLCNSITSAVEENAGEMNKKIIYTYYIKINK